MKTYKVYFRHNFKVTSAFVEAKDLDQVKWKILSRFNFATIQNIVEIQ